LDHAFFGACLYTNLYIKPLQIEKVSERKTKISNLIQIKKIALLKTSPDEKHQKHLLKLFFLNPSL